MRYSIEDAIALIRRWKDSNSIIRVVFSDTATGGQFSALITEVDDTSLPPPMLVSVSMKVLLVNGIPGSSLIDVNFWGSEEIEFSDFTDEPVPLIPPDDLDHFTSCLAIQYETGAIVKVCETWPSEALDTLRGPVLPFLN